MTERYLAGLVAFAVVITSCTAGQIAGTTDQGTAPRPPATTSTTVDPSSLGIEGLQFDEFLETSFAVLAVRDPQGLTSAGVAESHGLGNDQLNDLSDTYIRATQAIQTAILKELRGFGRDSLTPQQQVSYDSYEWYLDNLVQGHRFIYHNWPVHHFVNSYNFNLLLFLTDEHPVESVQDAEDYVTRLSQIDRQVGEVIDGLQRRVDAGVLPAAEIVDRTIRRLEGDLGGATNGALVEVGRLSLYATFAEKLGANEGITATQRDDLLERAIHELEASFVPAWLGLADYMRSIRPLASDQAGVHRHPDGDAYYQYLLKGQTSTDLNPQEIHELGLFHVHRVEDELRQAFDGLGYPQGDSLIELQNRAATEAGFISGPSAIALNKALIEEADEAFRPWFELWPPYPVQVVPDPGGGGYYLRGSVDGSRLGAFYAGSGGSSLVSLPTINFHEAVPGHHTQIAIAQSLDLPSFQRFVTHNGFVEGWALYAERLAWEAGMYEDDPYGNIGRLQLELLRAVRLVVDTGIHHLGWSSSEARSYMNTVIPAWSQEVERYMVLPGQATGYMVGMQEILRLRDLVMREKGADFDIAEFHTLILGQGSQPLVILEQIVSDYVEGDGS